MTIKQLAAQAIDKSNFTTLPGFLNFCQRYLDFIAAPGNLQAVIVSQNENQYQFWQYGKSGNYQITRPINADLMYQPTTFEGVRTNFVFTLQTLRDAKADRETRIMLNNAVYTIQQSIGAALDALPVGESNKARVVI